MGVDRPDTRPARTARSRLALQKALIDMLEEQPFADILVAPLAKRAGVGYATFFRHYADKEALLADAAGALVEDLATRTLPLLQAGDGRAAMRALVGRVAADRSLCRTLLTGVGETVRGRVTALAIERAMAAPPVAPSRLPRDLEVMHVVGATLTILTWWLSRGAALSADAVADILYDLVLAPLETTTAMAASPQPGA